MYIHISICIHVYISWLKEKHKTHSVVWFLHLSPQPKKIATKLRHYLLSIAQHPQRLPRAARQVRRLPPVELVVPQLLGCHGVMVWVAPINWPEIIGVSLGFWYNPLQMESMGPVLTTGSAPLCTSDIWKNIIQKTSSKGRSTHQTTFTFFNSVNSMYQEFWIPNMYVSDPMDSLHQPAMFRVMLSWCGATPYAWRQGVPLRDHLPPQWSVWGLRCHARRPHHRPSWRVDQQGTNRNWESNQKKTQQKVIWHPQKKNWMGQLLFLFVTFSKIYLRLFFHFSAAKSLCWHSIRQSHF